MAERHPRIPGARAWTHPALAPPLAAVLARHGAQIDAAVAAARAADDPCVVVVRALSLGPRCIGVAAMPKDETFGLLESIAATGGGNAVAVAEVTPGLRECCADCAAVAAGPGPRPVPVLALLREGCAVWIEGDEAAMPGGARG